MIGLVGIYLAVGGGLACAATVQVIQDRDEFRRELDKESEEPLSTPAVVLAALGAILVLFVAWPLLLLHLIRRGE